MKSRLRKAHWNFRFTVKLPPKFIRPPLPHKVLLRKDKWTNINMALYYRTLMVFTIWTLMGLYPRQCYMIASNLNMRVEISISLLKKFWNCPWGNGRGKGISLWGEFFIGIFSGMGLTPAPGETTVWIQFFLGCEIYIKMSILILL